MKEFSRTWKRSKIPRKQRKYSFKAPLHIKQKFLHSHLSRDLKKRYGKRSAMLRKGDKVKVSAGKFRNHEGKVNSIDLKKTAAFVDGIETTKRDGTKKRLPLHPSKLVITELNLDDKLRQKILERK